MNRVILTAAITAVGITTISVAQPDTVMPGETTGSAMRKESPESMKVGKSDEAFLTKAAIGGLAEVAGGQMASTQGSIDDVQAFGKQMAADHGKANEELKALAASKGVTLPTDTDEKHKDAAKKLGALAGADFDKAYAKQAVNDHIATIELFEKGAKSEDTDVRTWASKTLPTLRHHLEMAKDLAKKVGEKGAMEKAEKKAAKMGDKEAIEQTK